VPEVVALLPSDPDARAEALCSAVARYAGVTGAILDFSPLESMPSGAALVCLPRDGYVLRCLDTVARRRGTNPVEALHAAVRADFDT
jgi:hypothetical protein